MLRSWKACPARLGDAGCGLGRVVQDATLGAHEAHVGAAHPASLGGRQLHARLADKRRRAQVKAQRRPVDGE